MKHLRQSIYAALMVAGLSVQLLAPVQAHSKSEDSTAAHAAGSPTGSHAAPVHRNGVREEIVIKAPAGAVWQGILEQRKHDPDLKYCKEISGNEKQKIFEQKFIFPSFLGDTECILHLSELPGERIDFRLHESEDLKKMEGSWVLTPINNGQATKLSLSSYVESKDPIPRLVTNSIISGKARKNLAMVKKFAEKSL